MMLNFSTWAILHQTAAVNTMQFVLFFWTM